MKNITDKTLFFRPDPQDVNIGKTESQKEQNPKTNLLQHLETLNKIFSIYKDIGFELEYKKKEYDIIVNNLIELCENIISYQNILSQFYRNEITKLNQVIQKLTKIIQDTEENLEHFKVASNHFRDIGIAKDLTFKNIEYIIFKNKKLKKQCENFQKRFR